jgi:hypothetical protein
MKKFSICCATAMLMGALVLPALGQDNNNPPPPPGDQQQDNGGPPHRGPGGRGPGGPGGGPEMRPPPEAGRFEMLRGYLDLVDRFSRMSHDPSASGIAAVLSANDILRQQGGIHEAINYFTKILPEVKDEAVQRTIRIELVDLYKQSGEIDKAIEQLNILMTSSSSPTGMTPPRTP